MHNLIRPLHLMASIALSSASLLSFHSERPSSSATTYEFNRSHETVPSDGAEPDEGTDMPSLAEQVATFLLRLNKEEQLPTLGELLNTEALGRLDTKKFKLLVMLHLAKAGLAPALDWLQAHATELDLNETIREELASAPLPHWPIIKMAITLGATESQAPFGTYALLSASPEILRWLFEHPHYKQALLRASILNKRMAKALLSAARSQRDVIDVLAILLRYPLLQNDLLNDDGHRDSEGRTILMQALDNANTSNDPKAAVARELIPVLLKKGADIDVTDNNGETPLVYATRLGDIPSVALLLEMGALINLPDKAELTALSYARGNDALEKLFAQHLNMNQEELFTPRASAQSDAKNSGIAHVTQSSN